jgi:hypothetical protein
VYDVTRRFLVVNIDINSICSDLERKYGPGAYVCSLKILYELGLDVPMSLSIFIERLLNHGHRHHERFAYKSSGTSIRSLCTKINHGLVEMGSNLRVVERRSIENKRGVKYGDTWIFLTGSERKYISVDSVVDGIRVRDNTSHPS